MNDSGPHPVAFVVFFGGMLCLSVGSRILGLYRITGTRHLVRHVLGLVLFPFFVVVFILMEQPRDVTTLLRTALWGLPASVVWFFYSWKWTSNRMSGTTVFIRPPTFGILRWSLRKCVYYLLAMTSIQLFVFPYFLHIITPIMLTMCFACAYGEVGMVAWLLWQEHAVGALILEEVSD